MNPETGRKLVAVAFLIAIVMVTWSEIKGAPAYDSNGNETGTKSYILPRPQRYWLSTIAFIGLSVVAMADTLSLMAGVIGLGIDIAVWMELFATANITNPTQGKNTQPPGTQNA